MVPQVHPELLEQRVQPGLLAQLELARLARLGLPAKPGLPGQLEQLERLAPAQLGRLGRLGRLEPPGRRGKADHLSHFWQKLRQR